MIAVQSEQNRRCESHLLQEKNYYISLYQLKNKANFMNSCSPCQPYINQLSNQLWTEIVNHLNEDDLNFFIQSTAKSNFSKRLLTILRTQFLFKKYINAGDRAYYYSLFQHPNFINMEGSHLASLSFQCRLLAKFQMFPRRLQEVAQKSTKELPLEMRQSVRQKLVSLATDPGISLPALKRQNIGIYANSAFQNFLVQQGEGEKEYFFLEQQLENLKFYLTENDKKYFSSLHSIDKAKLKQFLENPQQITFSNMRTFWIQQNSLHNLIISFFVLLDLRLATIHDYISTLQEPFHRFMELITRYSIYQSMVLNIQENFAFVFEQYSQICGQIFNEKVTMNLWKPAMKKWFRMASQFQRQNNLIFHGLVSEKVKNELIKQNYAESLGEIPNPQSQIDYKDQIYELVVNDPCDLDILLENYQQYLVDISLSKIGVFWCGHTEQRLDKPYQNYEDCFMEKEKEYLLGLKALIQRNSMMKKMLIQRLELQSRILKPKIMKKLIEFMNAYMFYCQVPCQQRFLVMNQNVERANKYSLHLYLEPPEKQIEWNESMKIDLNKTNDLSMEIELPY